MNEHECIHSELLQSHSLQLAELETKSRYKEQTIMEIKEDLKEVNKKLDKLINKSETSDTKLEKRVELIETKLDLYEKFFPDLKEDEKTRKEDGDKKTKNIIAICNFTNIDNR